MVRASNVCSAGAVWGAWGVLAAALLTRACVWATSEPPACSPRVLLHSGWACGLRRSTGNHTEFASFLGVPYARQPLAELRFKELQPVEPWAEAYEATREGPVCPQHDVFYGRIMRAGGGAPSEACVHASVHAPLHALPAAPRARAPAPPPPHALAADAEGGAGLPVLVFVHGGGFAFGSGDTDLYGPEYLVSQDVIVVTFNYRLNVFGFLSLNNSHIPGNNGLRDMVTLLRWVRVNARAFGGNPDDVTLAGHSAGAASAHLLTLSKAAEGLFRRVLLMSGTALPTFYTTAPAYAQFVSNMFLTGLGISSKDPEEVHEQLTKMPLENIMQVHNSMQDQFGMAVFYPVVETSGSSNFTTILDDDPEALILKGCGKDIPLMVGFTNAECYGFLPRFEEIDIVSRIKSSPIIMTPLHLIYRRPPKVALDIAGRVQARYFKTMPTMDQYVQSCTESNFIYPAMKVALLRAATGGAPAYLYEFSYQSEFSIKKFVDNVNYKGAGHLEDVTYLFRVNSILGPEGTLNMTRNDEDIKDWFVELVTNFIRCSDPACNREKPPGFATPWPPFSRYEMMYQGINMPFYRTLEVSSDQLDMLRFFDSLQNRTS